MSIPFMQGFPVRQSESRVAVYPGQGQKTTFDAALTAAVRDGIQGQGKQPKNEALSRQEIAVLILKMQQQLNDHLFSALSTDYNRENEDLPWTGTSFPASGAAVSPAPAFMPSAAKTPTFAGQASNIQQSTQKNDGFSSTGNLDHLIGQAADAYGVDENLIRSVIKAESNFSVRSTSLRGAVGLMQLMPDTARELGVRDAYDPRENIMGGTKYLKGLLDRYGGDTGLALAAYNWGMGNVEKYPGRLPQETRTYIDRVTRYYKEAKA